MKLLRSGLIIGVIFFPFKNGLTIKCIGQELSSEKIGVLIKIDNDFEDYKYMPNEVVLPNFSILDPGFVLIPQGNGIAVAGWNTWFLDPGKLNYMAGSPLSADTSFYYIGYNSFGVELIKLKKTKGISNKEVIHILPKGIYNFKPVSANLIYLWGLDNKGWHLWSLKNGVRKPIYHSSTSINDIALINESNLILATGNILLKVSSDQPPVNFFELESSIDGVEIDSDGKLYVSTAGGIIRVNSADGSGDTELIAEKIHGPLILYKEGLYINWLEQSRVVKVNLE